MVHKEFIWPYGGREVFLSFSCTGWTDRTPMAPVESSPAIFRAICDLPLGYHRFKYMVDGAWRFDHEQFHVADEFGGFNNVIQVTDTKSTSSSLHGVAFEPCMEVDNVENLQDQASSSGATRYEPELQLLENETDVCRQRLSTRLSSQSIYELIPDSGKVFTLDVESAVKDAYYVMYKEGLTTLPVWNGIRRRFVGMMTASDFILILIELHKTRAVLPNELLERHTISAWKEGKSQVYGDVVGAAQLLLRPLIHADPDETLRNVALRILHNKISTIPVIHSKNEGSCSNLLYVSCLAGILKYVCRQCKNNPDYFPLLQKPIGSITLGTWAGTGASDQIIALHPSDTLGSALKLLIEAQISSIPIVDDKGSLINLYSRSDIYSLAKDGAYTRIRLDQTMLSQVVELVDGRRYKTCTRSDPFYLVMERLSDPVVRRLFVIEAGSRKVEGIITLTDVFRYILS